jgi:hypothetical protein
MQISRTYRKKGKEPKNHFETITAVFSRSFLICFEAVDQSQALSPFAVFCEEALLDFYKPGVICFQFAASSKGKTHTVGVWPENT